MPQWPAIFMVAMLIALPAAARADYCPVGKLYPAESNCQCPPGSQSSGLNVCGNGCFKECVAVQGATISGCAVEQELAANFAWFREESHGAEAVAARKNILRASSITDTGDVTAIRRFFKQGQRHNPRVAALIDQCDDDHVRRIAYQFAERSVRLKSCGDPPPASSATCADIAENLRWSVFDSGNCAPYARDWLAKAMDSSQIPKARAERVRRAIMVAQGHDLSVAASADFISDALLVRIAEKTFNERAIGRLDRRAGDASNPFVRQSCPGAALFEKYQ